MQFPPRNSAPPVGKSIPIEFGRPMFFLPARFPPTSIIYARIQLEAHCIELRGCAECLECRVLGAREASVTATHYIDYSAQTVSKIHEIKPTDTGQLSVNQLSLALKRGPTSSPLTSIRPAPRMDGISVTAHSRSASLADDMVSFATGGLTPSAADEKLMNQIDTNGRRHISKDDGSPTRKGGLPSGQDKPALWRQDILDPRRGASSVTFSPAVTPAAWRTKGHDAQDRQRTEGRQRFLTMNTSRSIQRYSYDGHQPAHKGMVGPQEMFLQRGGRPNRR